MNINDIKPYERNARRNSEAIPVVAESIKEFGLKGQIVLESRENPVIVAGHTRWAACKYLGWEEIPDERIDYCDDLTEDQIKAYRLADNRTGEVAKWNTSLLQTEIKALDKSAFDMERFRFNFKSKSAPPGAERLRTDKAYNLHLVNADDCSGPYGMPTLRGVDHKPKDMIRFSYVKQQTEGFDKCVHFFIDDYQFERVWNKPEAYLSVLRRFDSVLTPEFSCYLDMPLPMQQWNEYRRRALGHYWQRHGLTVIPTVIWGHEDTYDFSFDGLPKHSTIAVNTNSCKSDDAGREMWDKGMAEALRRLEPSRVLLYGGSTGFDFGDVEVVEYQKDVAIWKDK